MKSASIVLACVATLFAFLTPTMGAPAPRSSRGIISPSIRPSLVTSVNNVVPRSNVTTGRADNYMILVCRDPNYLNCQQIEPEAGACYEISADYAHLVSSIFLPSGVYCRAYEGRGCLHNSVAIDGSNTDLSTLGFNDRMSAVQCHDNWGKKRSVETKGLAARANTTIAAVANNYLILVCRDTLFLYCQQINPATGDCYNLSHDIAFQASSVFLPDGVYCRAYEGAGCLHNSVNIDKSNADLTTIGFNDRAAAFQCHDNWSKKRTVAENITLGI